MLARAGPRCSHIENVPEAVKVILADMRRQHAEVAELRREIEGLRGTLPVAKQISEAVTGSIVLK